MPRISRGCLTPGSGGRRDELGGPELGDEQAAEPGARGFAVKSRERQRFAPWRNLADGEASEQAESRIESGDDGARKPGAETARGGDLEF